MKRIFIFLCLGLLMFSNAFALNLARVKEWGTSDILTAADLNAEFNNILDHSIANADISATAAIAGSKIDFTVSSAIGSTTPNTGAFTTLSTTGATTIGDAAADTILFNANSISFEGATADANETSVTITDPTADRTLTIPNANSTVLPSGAVFFMITGSCPPGTTNVTSTYADKFMRINATGNLTGGNDTHSHTLETANIPAHTHTADLYSVAAGNEFARGGTTLETSAKATSSTGSGTAFTGTNVPAFFTCIVCQVD